MVRQSHDRRPVLLIDDSHEDLFLAQRLLARAEIQHPVVTIDGGEQALDYLRAAAAADAGTRLPVVVFCDIKMPVQNGFDVLTWVRGQEPLKKLPFFILSGANLEADKARAKTLGADGYLVKFPTSDTFREIIQSVDSA